MDFGWLKILLDIIKGAIKKKSPSGQDLIATDLKVIQDVYRSTIEDLRIELHEQKIIIESYRHKHPGNGEELDEWTKREELLSQRIIILEKKILDLKGQLIFWHKMKFDHKIEAIDFWEIQKEDDKNNLP